MNTPTIMYMLLDQYAPSWVYEPNEHDHALDQAGFKCNFCGALIKHMHDFAAPSFHEPGCAWPPALAWRDMERAKVKP